MDSVVPDGHPLEDDLRALRRQLEAHWSADTSFWPEQWSPERPSLGQCAVTALVVHDRFGGEIWRTVNEGVVHYGNRINGAEIDLTRDQFETWAPEAIVTVDPAAVATSGPTLAARHRTLAARLDPDPPSRPRMTRRAPTPRRSRGGRG